METKAQRLLSAAVKLARAPEHCVVYEADPRGVTAAHNTSMRAVGLTTLLPAYELTQADLIVSRLDDLTIQNVRRLFANQGMEVNCVSIFFPHSFRQWGWQGSHLAPLPLISFPRSPNAISVDGPSD